MYLFQKCGQAPQPIGICPALWQAIVPRAETPLCQIAIGSSLGYDRLSLDTDPSTGQNHSEVVAAVAALSQSRQSILVDKRQRPCERLKLPMQFLHLLHPRGHIIKCGHSFCHAQKSSLLHILDIIPYIVVIFNGLPQIETGHFSHGTCGGSFGLACPSSISLPYRRRACSDSWMPMRRSAVQRRRETHSPQALRSAPRS